LIIEVEYLISYPDIVPELPSSPVEVHVRSHEFNMHEDIVRSALAVQC